MTDASGSPPRERVRSVRFPILSMSAALLCLAWLALAQAPGLPGDIQIPTTWQSKEVMATLAVAVTLLALFDLRRYHRQRQLQGQEITQLQTLVGELWESKKQLQLKAHTYSGHADKLKLFISDKLLEYIEYDEKFLHFKSIAAEVRHNGVISYDKVQSALQQALTKARQAEDLAQGDGEAQTYQSALDAMRYLWDLLDLSTADNLALHIGNLLCECEEQYCQQLLEIEQAGQLPFEPVYDPQLAAWRALALVHQEPMPTPVAQERYQIDDGKWYASLAPTGMLLGNANHFVLLLENLLRNAQFFSARRGYKTPSAAIAFTLAEEQGQVVLRIYNRGPHIPEDSFDKLFQLGFSTRRSLEHQGRGLGLYFVDQIVKGYEGRIRVQNVHTLQTQYAVRIALDDDSVLTEVISVIVEDGKPQCLTEDGNLTDERSWSFEQPLQSIEVTITGSGSTQPLRDFETKGKQERFDPAHPERPHWRFTYKPKRHAHELVFEPLNINGVEFEITLPTAQARLEGSDLVLEDNIDAEVERLDARFEHAVKGNGDTRD